MLNAKQKTRAEHADIEKERKESSGKLRKLGISLIVLSFVFWGGLLIVPFIQYSVGIKIAISTVLAVLGEVSFWIGAFILGKEVIARYKKYLNPFRWFKR